MSIPPHPFFPSRSQVYSLESGSLPALLLLRHLPPPQWFIDAAQVGILCEEVGGYYAVVSSPQILALDVGG